MQNIRRFTSVFIVSAVLALLPPALTYLFTGELPDTGVTLVSSITTGLIGSVGTALAETLRKPHPA